MEQQQAKSLRNRFLFLNLRRTKLRETRIQPETTSNKSEEELIILSSRKTSTSTRPRSAPNDTKRTVSYGATESEIIHFYLRTENENTFLFFLLPLFDAFLVLVKTGPVAALMCRNVS